MNEKELTSDHSKWSGCSENLVLRLPGLLGRLWGQDGRELSPRRGTREGKSYMRSESSSVSSQGDWAFPSLAVGLPGPGWDVHENTLKLEEAESPGLPGDGALS